MTVTVDLFAKPETEAAPTFYVEFALGDDEWTHTYPSVSERQATEILTEATGDPLLVESMLSSSYSTYIVDGSEITRPVVHEYSDGSTFTLHKLRD